VHLVGYLKNKSITMQGNMNVKKVSSLMFTGIRSRVINLLFTGDSGGKISYEQASNNFHGFIVHLDTFKSRLLSNGRTIKYTKKNVKIYIKVNIKMLLHVSVQNDHHQGVRRLCFAKFIKIKIVN